MSPVSICCRSGITDVAEANKVDKNISFMLDLSFKIWLISKIGPGKFWVPVRRFFEGPNIITT